MAEGADNLDNLEMNITDLEDSDAYADKEKNSNASIFLDFKTLNLTIIRNINDKWDLDSRVPGLLVSIHWQ